jgi:hypothetical protein
MDVEVVQVRTHLEGLFGDILEVVDSHGDLPNP